MRKSMAVFALAILLSVVFISAGFAQAPAAPLAGKKVLLVTKYDGKAPHPHDAVLIERMAKFGLTTTPAMGKLLTGDEAKDYDFIFVSEVADSNAVKAKFADAKIPILICEQYIDDDMGFTGVGPKDFGKIDAFPGVTKIVNETHPLAAGLKGEVKIYAKPGSVTFGKPGGDVQVIAVAPNDDKTALIFAYDKGAKNMLGEVMPARRVMFFLFGDQENNMTEEGWKLFDAAVLWAMGKL